MARKALNPEQVLRDYAMGFPEATEHFPWGERVVKVRGKVFVFLSQGERFRLSVKLPLSGLAALTLPFASPTGYGLGKSGWVSASFERTGEGEVPLGILKSWIEESYRAVAPKALAESLPPGGEAARPMTPKRGLAKGAAAKKTIATEAPVSKPKRPPQKPAGQKRRRAPVQSRSLSRTRKAP